MEDKNFLREIKALDHLIINRLSVDCISNINRITPSQIHILEYIINSPKKEVYQKDLEKIINHSRATVSSVLITMEKNGLIKRITDNNDTRIKKIVLSNKALNVFEKSKKNINLIEKECLNGISQNDLCIFYKVLNKMKNNLQRKDDIYDEII
ncbi:MAG: MarR family transcriptional regulator [bacterium]|nr:MarR family transcriptional regulator [bacterium]